MTHERLKNETIERLKKAKSRFHSRSYDDVVNKGLDAFEGKELRKLQEKINGLTRANNDLTAVNLERREENKKLIEEKKSLEDQNQQQINDLKEKNNAKIENLNKKHDVEINKKNYIIETLTKKIKDFEEQETQLSKIEPQTKAEAQENAELPAMKTSIETERTTERVIEKQKIVQEAVLPDVFEGKKILCPKTNREVSMKEQCNIKNCKDFLECKVYVQTIKEVYSFNE
jgi:HD superfamily phosphohydrolase